MDEEEFASLDDCISMTGNYLHHADFGPDYVCDIYHTEHVTCSGFDLNTAVNSYCLSPQCMIKDQDYEALHPYLLWLSIDHIKHTLATFMQWFCNAYCIPFHKHFNSCFLAANVSIIMNPLLLTLCSPMSLCEEVMPRLPRHLLGIILITLMSMGF